MTIREVECLLDGWTGMKLEVYVDGDGDYRTVYNNHCDCAVPDKYADCEITTISVENGDIVLKCDYWEDDEDDDEN